MKSITLVLILLLALYSTHCSPVNKNSLTKTNKQLKNSIIKEKKDVVGPLNSCENCFDFSVFFCRALSDGIIDSFIMDGCVGFCYELVLHYNSTLTVEIVCNTLCDAVGIEKLKDIAKNLDMGPITLCQVLNACPVKDDGDAKFTKISVSPNSGPQGVFVVDFEYYSRNGTGTGEFGINVVTMDSVPYQFTYLNLAKEPGTYSSNITINAIPDKTCEIDPHWFGPCESWIPGHYLLTIAICNGECFGSDEYPHTKLYDKIISNFTITA